MYDQELTPKFYELTNIYIYFGSLCYRQELQLTPDDGIICRNIHIMSVNPFVIPPSVSLIVIVITMVTHGHQPF
jgi:hypothetical protein